MDHSYCFSFLAISYIAFSPPRKKTKTTNDPFDSNDGLRFNPDGINLVDLDLLLPSPNPNFVELPLPEGTVDSTDSFSQEPDSSITNDAVDGVDVQQLLDYYNDLGKCLGIYEQSTDQSNQNINNDNDIADDNNVLRATARLEENNGDSDDVNGAHSHACGPSTTGGLEVINRANWDVDRVNFDVGGPSSATARLEDNNGDSDDVNGAHSHACGPSTTGRLEVINRANCDVDRVNFDVGGPSSATARLEDNNGDSDDVNGAHSHACGPSTTGRLEVINRANCDVDGVNFDEGPSSAIAPLTQTALLCTLCKRNNMLREIVHTKDGETRRLRMFGEIGRVSHVILSTQLFSSDGKEFQNQDPPVDMRGYKLERVKKYIEDYCTEREEKGLMRVQDTNDDFFQAMSASSNFNPPARHMVPLTSLIQVPISLDEAGDDQPHVELRDEPTLSAEKKTPPKLGVSDLISLFHLPIKKAAENIKMNETTLRNISREYGVIRWPSRKVNANRTRTARYKAKLLEARDSKAKESAESELQNLQKEYEKIVSDAFKPQ